MWCISSSNKNPIEESFYLKPIFNDEQHAEGYLNLSKIKIVALQYISLSRKPY